LKLWILVAKLTKGWFVGWSNKVKHLIAEINVIGGGGMPFSRYRHSEIRFLSYSRAIANQWAFGACQK